MVLWLVLILALYYNNKHTAIFYCEERPSFKFGLYAVNNLVVVSKETWEWCQGRRSRVGPAYACDRKTIKNC